MNVKKAMTLTFTTYDGSRITLAELDLADGYRLTLSPKATSLTPTPSPAEITLKTEELRHMIDELVGLRDAKRDDSDGK